MARGGGAMTALNLFVSVKASVAALLAVAPVPELAFILQAAAVGAAIGSAVGLRARRRDVDADTWRITTAWATLGLIVGAGIVAILAL